MAADTKRYDNNIQVALIGSADFCRRLNSILVALNAGVKTYHGGFSEAWGIILTNRPNVVVIEIGLQYSEKTHTAARRLLEQLRERLAREIYVIAALTAPEKLLYAGDLLFLSDNELSPSGFIDTFIALPPSAAPSIPDLSAQIQNILALYDRELTRRAAGDIALPSLGADGWVQSLADPKSRELWMRWLPRYASYTNENPIIIGATGTGKTNLAYALHLLSGRKGKFISITPRDFSSSELVQAELFGAVAGAYTGAVDKWGLVKSAENGTLFIDELQSIDKELQGKLITFIENKTYRRVGSAETIAADVRFVFASNRTLYDMMESDILRHDFAYRLERVQLELLPLHHRSLDVTAALGYALAKIRRQRPHGNPTYGFNSIAYRLLFMNKWPGNLRQLENHVAKLCEIADMNSATLIDEQTVVQVLQSRLSGGITTPPEIISRAAALLSQEALSGNLESLENSIERLSQMVRSTALDASAGDVDLAAELIHDSSNAMLLFSKAQIARQQLV